MSEQPKAESRSGLQRRLPHAIVAISLIVAAAVTWAYLVPASTITQAESALNSHQYWTAHELASKVLQTEPTSNRALLVAGTASLATNNAADAKGYFQQISKDDVPRFAVAQRELGRIALASGQAVSAEELLRRSLELAPTDLRTVDQLIYLLSLEGRYREAYVLAADQIQAGNVNANYLTIVGQPDLGLKQASQFAERCLSVAPDESLPRLALAQQAWRDNHARIAREHLIEVVRLHPDLPEAQGLLSLVTAETGTLDECDKLLARTPSAADHHPMIWLSRGIRSERRGHLEQAARCYWEALRLDPNLIQPNYRLSLALKKLGKSEAAQPFAERSRLLGELVLEIASLTNKVDWERIPKIVEQLESLGRCWEAAGWCQVAIREAQAEPEWARKAAARLAKQLVNQQALTLPTVDPSRQIDLSAYRIPETTNDRVPVSPRPTAETSSQIAFQDEADAAGLKFTYQNGAQGGDVESMLEMNGGGVAVLDYDGDHWPDVFFTQGGQLPPAAFGGSPTDQLFRNRGEAGSEQTAPGFVNVTSSAGMHDSGYGQGVSVGDYDNDGFPDLYVGNVGANQLWHNNGDGTFSDVTKASGMAAGGWTSSSVIADFNQDGLPDIYVVTYLGGDRIYQPCSKRLPPRCTPLRYPAEPDRFYLNMGDGQFQDLTGTHGIAGENGRGLGVLAADFNNTGRLSLFVANDMTANFFFQNETQSPDVPEFQERAVAAGLAFDQTGLVKACMGIAAADYNRDGRLDLFVTNFYRQTNDLYTQNPDGSFDDLSRQANLAEPGFLMLGWGTQALDADLDGLPDLMVTNGHVHDPVDPTIPFAMPTQFFRNLGRGQFSEIPRPQLGPFFERPRHGRAMARLDWNRDGLEDLCITSNNEPAALLTNHSATAGNSLAFRLIAVNSARDAIGAKVRIRVGEETTTLQLVGGDGFQAANERRLHCGMGPNLRADSVEIEWPSGVRQKFDHLAANCEWLMIEQRAPIALRALVINRHLSDHNR